MNHRDDDGAKTFLDGTHRVVDPATTLAKIRPFAASMGITRVAVLTGLDVIGIPVAAAVRPNSRSVAVHQGKGATLDAAKASAVMEAVECFHAENIALPLRRESFATLSQDTNAADPATLPHCAGRSYAGETLLWIEARDLMSHRPLWLPHELVSADFTDTAMKCPGPTPSCPRRRASTSSCAVEQDVDGRIRGHDGTVVDRSRSGASLPEPAGLFQATTNGLASGNHRLEAVLHALYEVVERDAVALWRALPERMQDERGLDADAVDGRLARRLLAAFAAAGVAVHLWDVTSDIGLPAFVCLAAAAAEADAVEPELGSGCHADRDIALSRALTEAAQARLTRISGARDDFDVGGYRPEQRAARQDAARRWMTAPARGGFRAPAALAAPTLRQDLDTVLERMSAAGMSQAGCVDLTRAEFGIPVVRVIVPGLEGPWTPPGSEYTPGVRARMIA